MRGFAVVAVISLLAAASPALAQSPAPPAPPAAPKVAPAPPAQPAAPKAAPAMPALPAADTPPRPFPEGSKVAYVVLQRIANESADGRVATTRIQALQQKKAADLTEKNRQLAAAQQKLEKEGSVMSVTAQGDVQKQIDRLTLEVQRFTQDAQAEVQELQQQLQQEFQQRLEPVLQAVAQEKGLQLVFNGPDAGLVWADPALDISSDIIRRLDSAKPSTAKPVPPATKPPGQ
jgi:outer membrane protein